MILIATQTFAPDKGGMETYMTSLAAELAKAENEVIVFADGKDKKYKPEASFIIKRFGGWRPYRRWKKRKATARLFTSRMIEGVFCDSWKSIESLSEKYTPPVVVLAHGAEYPLFPSKRKKQRIEAALSRATAILANSHYTADIVRAYLPRPDDLRLKVVHPPINPLPSPTRDAQQEIRSLVGGRAPVLSVLARLEPRKGIDRVIAAMPEIIARYPSALFLVGGEGDDLKRLHALAEEKGVSEHVAFLGSLDNDKKGAMFVASDIYAMPVRRVGTSVEGFGISYIEAAWFGVPSLGGREGGAQDAVIDGRTGLLCDGENQTEVTVKLLQLLDDGPLRRKFGIGAKEYVENELLWEKALPKFLSALRLPAR
ncbi:MAG: glycosyltransferase family 4 protein [Bdellovibrionales bacterium]